jgi:DeoR/GlpR family transcriptional regulator of sugar metabolism
MRVSPNDVGYRMTFDYEVKRRIARRAADMVGSGEAVMIESGSTCAMLAEELVRKKRDVTIITNSAFIAGYVRSIPGARWCCSAARMIGRAGDERPPRGQMRGRILCR